MAGFWSQALYWFILFILIIGFILFMLAAKDFWHKYKIIRSVGRHHIKASVIFCRKVKVELLNPPLESPIMCCPCLNYSSIIRKTYRKRQHKIYFEENAQSDFIMCYDDIRFLPPDPESAIFIRPEFQFHKKWLEGNLPEKLAEKLRRLDLDESFWKGQRTSTIDCDETILPIQQELWVYGRLQGTDQANGELRLVGLANGQQPIVAASYQHLRDWSRYALINHVIATIGFFLFTIVTAYVLR